MVVLRPCEAKLSGLRCLTIIGTEGALADLRRERSAGSGDNECWGSERGAVRSYLMTFHITAVTTANTPNQIDVTVASKSPVSTYPSAVVRLVAECNLSGASVILEALRGSQTLVANAAAIVAPIHPLQGPSPKRG
jgi:hypothetical protein